MTPVTVATVLRSGGDFDASWVAALQRGVSEHLPLPHRFVCLSDVPVPCERIPLEHDWPGWWAKVEVYRLNGPVLYMDLDTLPWGDLAGLVGALSDTRLAVLSDFYQPQKAASGVVWFGEDYDAGAVYRTFSGDAQAIMEAHRRRSDAWYRTVWRKPARIQDLAPGQVVSLKAHARHEVPEGARLVCGHGQPRFSSPKAGWAHGAWRERAA